jgi:major membrane immunogen (membrane-anchored lipoprotein)
MISDSRRVINMRKLSTYVLTIAFAFALMGCGANNENINDNNAPNNSGTELQKEITNSTANNDEKNAPGDNTATNPQQEITNSTAIRAEDNAPGNNASGNGYIDGVYGSMYKNQQTGYEEAIITIQNGKIQNVELKKLDDNKKEVNYDEWDGTKSGYPNLKQYRIDLAKAMINKQSPEVDVIAGATWSSNGWKAAAANALKNAK